MAGYSGGARPRGRTTSNESRAEQDGCCYPKDARRIKGKGYAAAGKRGKAQAGRVLRKSKCHIHASSYG